MLNISIRKVDFNELNIENLSKRPILDTLEKFYKGSESEYYEFLEQNGLSYFKSFSTMAELKEIMDNDVKTLNDIAENTTNNKLDFKTINFLKSKNLKEVQEHEFYKLTIDLREVNEKEKEHIKDLFLETKSVSLVDFMDIDGDYCSLIYHKKGAFYYNDEPFMNNAKPEQLTLLENYALPKDNNFIMGRFLFDLACKLDDNDIEESFCVKYSNGEKNIKNIQEVIYWGHLNAEEKREQKELIKSQLDTQKEALDLAKSELKAEVQASRESLKQAEAQKVLEEDKSTRLYTIAQMPKAQTQNDKPNSNDSPNTQQSADEKITEIIAKSMEIYRQKEMEKTKLRLEKAEKDSVNAYNDLKEYLNNGLSILEAIKNIQQKYRNDDTINFASLLFSKDILSLSQKEQEIITLNNEKEELKAETKEAYNEVEKREETISKLKSTLQTKLNEMKNYEYELQKDFEAKLQEKEAQMIEKLESFEAQQQNAISEYESEISELDNLNLELSNENKALQQSTLELKAKNASLEQMLEQNKAMLSESKETLKNNAENMNKLNTLNLELKNQNTMLERNLESSRKELESISNEFKAKLDEIESHTKKMYKLEAQAEIFDEKEKDYKEQMAELKQKNATLESKLNNILDSMLNKTQTPQDSQDSQAEKAKKNVRSRDILGD